MDLQFINQEIAEARLFRASGNFSRMDSNDIVNSLYLNTLLVFMFNQDPDKQDVAADYARRTVQYGSFSLFRTSSTDLYLLAYQALNPNNSIIQLANRASSRRDLSSLNFDRRQFMIFLRMIAQGRDARPHAVSYLLRLERQLEITDGRYRRWRRMVTDYTSLRDAQKQSLIAQLTQEMRRVGGGAGRSSELMLTLTTMLRRRTHTPMAKDRKIDQPDTARPGMAARLGGAAAGAVAGRIAGDRLSRVSNRTAKNIGTAAGAAAGYWAAGRRAKR